MWLREHPAVITATRVGKALDIDPMIVLDADAETWKIRLASALVAQADAEAAAAEAKRKG